VVSLACRVTSLCAAAATLVGCTQTVYEPITQQRPASERQTAHMPYRILFDFGNASGSCADGAWPWGGVVAVNGTVYGTTYLGGAHGDGIVFSLSAGGIQHLLYSFSGLGSLGGSGGGPVASLLPLGDTLYGTTPDGGIAESGMVFSIRLDGSHEHLLHAFGGPGDGTQPSASLIESNGTLYGTTSAGGRYGSGTVFGIRLRTSKEHVLYSFTGGSDGRMPQASLVSLGGRLYGTTAYGGTYGNGTVFSVSPSSGKERVLYDFRRLPDGSDPQAGLTVWSNRLYGTTAAGGQHGRGTVFSIGPAGRSFSVLHSFSGAPDGENPRASLLARNGILYGTTAQGGAYGGGRSDDAGTVFSLNAKTATERVLHSFGNNTDGRFPQSPVIEMNGKLYGTTTLGGVYSGSCGLSGGTSFGTVFALQLSRG
jgi:uncharacterized repeat protein (TIGR03803 family)